MNKVSTAAGLLLAIAAPVWAQPPGAGGGDYSTDSIIELRRAMGDSGEESLLRSDDAALAGEFRRLAAQPQPATFTPWGVPATHVGQQQPAPVVAPAFGNSPSSFGTQVAPPLLRDQAKPDDKCLLRQTAFELESLAHRLEMRDLVDQADEIRVVATKLRHSARRLPTPSAAPGLDPGPVTEALRGSRTGAGRSRASRTPGQLHFPAGRPANPEPAAPRTPSRPRDEANVVPGETSILQGP